MSVSLSVCLSILTLLGFELILTIYKCDAENVCASLKLSPILRSSILSINLTNKCNDRWMGDNFDNALSIIRECFGVSIAGIKLTLRLVSQSTSVYIWYCSRTFKRIFRIICYNFFYKLLIVGNTVTQLIFGILIFRVDNK